jgi:tetratricopeptide (TPR) repeat protein
LHEAQGDLPRALADFQAVLAVGQRLVALAPGGGGAPARAARDEARNSLGDSHNTLAVVHERMGALDSAGAHFAAALRIKRALAAEDRASAPRRKALGDAFFFAGSNAELRGDLAAARALLDSARAIAVGLTALDTANVDWARSAAAAATRLAALETAAGAPQAAVVHLAAARAGARVLAARAPDDPSALAHQARMAREEGAARAALGDRQGARAAAARAHALLDPVGGRPDLPAHVRWVLALTHLLDATLADAAPARQAAWAGVLRALGPAAPFEEPRHTALRARALVALGRGGEAAPLVARLRRARYAAPGDLALPPSS